MVKGGFLCQSAIRADIVTLTALRVSKNAENEQRICVKGRPDFVNRGHLEKRYIGNWQSVGTHVSGSVSDQGRKREGELDDRR